MILRFHQRRPREDNESGEVGRVEPAEPFGDVPRRAEDRIFQLPSALPVR